MIQILYFLPFIQIKQKKKKKRKKPQKPLLRKDICTSGFSAALITTTKVSEQPNFCG